MIVKSMSRKKSPAFRQLIAYFVREGLDEHAVLTRNLFALPESGNWMQIAKEFENNNRFLPMRSGGNHAYHEIIVLEHQPHLSKEKQTEILHDLAEQYLTRRAPNQLAFGCVHSDTDYTHIHLMLSANEVKSEQRVRLSKAELRTIVCDLEDYKVERYPELIGERLHRRGEARTDRARVSTSGYEAARRTGQSATQTEQVRDSVFRALEQSHSQDDATIRLETDGLSFYRRGNTWGIENADTGRRYRLKTLGLFDAFSDAQTRFGQFTERRETLADDHRSRLLHEVTREANSFEIEGGQ